MRINALEFRGEPCAVAWGNVMPALCVGKGVAFFQ
jgi:hypothetical protein